MCGCIFQPTTETISKKYFYNIVFHELIVFFSHCHIIYEYMIFLDPENDLLNIILRYS